MIEVVRRDPFAFGNTIVGPLGVVLAVIRVDLAVEVRIAVGLLGAVTGAIGVLCIRYRLIEQHVDCLEEEFVTDGGSSIDARERASEPVNIDANERGDA